MCDLSSMARPSATPGSTTAAAGAATSGVATCCPDAAEFKKQRRRTDYFGFDDKTDMTASGVDPYWVAQPGSAPGDKLTRDGAVWLSVEKGQKTKTKIHFTNNTRCIGNCTFEVRPANVATVLTASITSNRADFEIQGDRAGEASIVVVCNGTDIGWVHVACYDTLTFRVGMCKINQSLTTGTPPRTTLTLPNAAMNVATYQAFFNDAWRDAAVNVTLTALADYNVPAATNVAAGGGFWDANGTMSKAHFNANVSTGVFPVSDAIHTAVQRANPGYDKYLFLMPEPGRRAVGTSYINGYVRSIGGAYAIFFNVNSGTFSTAAHEFGHMVNLRHPNDTLGRSQFPTHLRAPTTRDAATNNVPPNDTLNLMGYGGPRPNRKRLRYKQWKAVTGR